MAVASETEVGVEADRDAGELGDALHADEHARHERRAVDRVVPDPEGLTGRAENDLLMSDRADHPYPVDPDSSRAFATAGTGIDLVGRGVGSPIRRGGRHPLGGVGCGAGRGVDLGVVVKLDDFGGLEMGSGEFGHADHQDGADREVRGDERIARSEQGLELLKIVLAEAGRPDDGMDAVGRGEPDRLPGDLEHGEVDHDLGSMLNEEVEGVVDIDAAGQLSGWIGFDGPADLLAHTSCGSDHSNSDHACRLGGRQRRVALGSTTVLAMLAAINDTSYNIMLFLHILTAVVAMAPAFVNPLLGKKLADGGHDISPMARYAAEHNQRIYGTALILSGLLGFGVAGMSDEVFKVSQGWLVAAVIICIAMNGLLHAVIRPSEKAMADGDRSAELQQKLQLGGGLFTLLFLVELYLMVFKPGLG